MFGREQPIQVEEPTTAKPAAGSDEMILQGPITLDLGKISDQPVAEGWHKVLIERCEARLSSDKKIPSLFVLARITDETDEDFNRTILWNLMLDGDGTRFTKRCLMAAGMPELLQFPTYQALADAVVGRELEAKVKHKTYQGELQAKVNTWRVSSPSLEL